MLLAGLYPRQSIRYYSSAIMLIALHVNPKAQSKALSRDGASRRRVMSCYCFACKTQSILEIRKLQRHILGNQIIAGGTISMGLGDQISQVGLQPWQSVRYRRQNHTLTITKSRNRQSETANWNRIITTPGKVQPPTACFFICCMKTPRYQNGASRHVALHVVLKKDWMKEREMQ